MVVRARSRIHDTTTTWSSIAGEIHADPSTLDSHGARATFTVDMSAFDAGDFLKNRKLKKDLDVAHHPQATFEVTGIRDIAHSMNDQFKATVTGALRWRGRAVELSIAGVGTMNRDRIDARGTFDLDVRSLGVTPPRFLMFKVEDEVTVEVTLSARVVSSYQED